MVWKTILVLFLAVGALGRIVDYQRFQAKQIVSQICKQNVSEPEKLLVEDTVLNYITCAQKLIDMDLLRSKIQNAFNSNDAAAEIYKMYCAKSAQLKTCLHTLMNGITPCLDESVKGHIDSANNATSELIDFVCYNDAERIITFIREGGPECIQTNTDKIKECLTKVTNRVGTEETIKQMSVEERCSVFDEVSTCALNKLKECNSPVPGKMAETLMQYVRKGSPCK